MRNKSATLLVYQKSEIDNGPFRKLPLSREKVCSRDLIGWSRALKVQTNSHSFDPEFQCRFEPHSLDNRIFWRSITLFPNW
mmetsp:Transcript_13891/g.39029  ORF Transcript_13891/g.39029 Transcript_13891/m.39029 type:complete len:81 (-) Transcript_13891:289-531(-)